MLNDDRRVTRDDLDADTGRSQSGHGIGGACLGRVDEYAQPREYEAVVVVRVDPCPACRLLPGNSQHAQSPGRMAIVKRTDSNPKRFVERYDLARPVLRLIAQVQHCLRRSLDDLDPVTRGLGQDRDAAPLEIKRPLVELVPAIERMAGRMGHQRVIQRTLEPRLECGVDGDAWPVWYFLRGGFRRDDAPATSHPVAAAGPGNGIDARRDQAPATPHA